MKTFNTRVVGHSGRKGTVHIEADREIPGPFPAAYVLDTERNLYPIVIVEYDGKRSNSFFYKIDLGTNFIPEIESVIGATITKDKARASETYSFGFVDFSTMTPTIHETYMDGRKRDTGVPEENMTYSVSYNPDNADHIRALTRFTKSLDMALALTDIVDIWRYYKHKNTTDAEDDVIRHFVDSINEILHDRGIILEDLVI